jgi:hypothetical protein
MICSSGSGGVLKICVDLRSGDSLQLIHDLLCQADGKLP